MSKVLRATCENGVVTADGVTVQEARVLSGGVGESIGVALIDEDRVDYIADTTPDLEEAIDETASALGSVSSALNAIGTTAGVDPLTLAALLLPISSAVSALNDLKGRLK